jgi:hypothetical protein
MSKIIGTPQRAGGERVTQLGHAARSGGPEKVLTSLSPAERCDPSMTHAAENSSPERVQTELPEGPTEPLQKT